MPISRHLSHLSQRGAAAFVLAALLALAPVAGAVAREDTHYQVELLVFLQPEGISAELPPPAPPPEPLPQDLPTVPETEAEPAGPAAGLPAGFMSPRAPLTLTAAAEALRRRGYQPLWHQAWIQPPGDREGVVLPLLAALGQGRATPGLDGTVSLTRGRFLHLGLDLQWQPGPSLEAEMTQRRRIRSGEEHYFDHPRLGVLALVQPVDYSPAGESAPAAATP
ncbi:CsiV family protein [Thioalkalivibrio sp. XN8]|uniref:CsiV family protein n=1 Tax=Thioalkalivibrio sp. XN8 TaxID=2712863 RepID=UPI0013ECB1CD|nr:CsiV family protein [Thioalkalivibrio sp. XN8]NGP52801.1 hypothetical protein [Thioalkalivibrio sp. XN8]